MRFAIDRMTDHEIGILYTLIECCFSLPHLLPSILASLPPSPFHSDIEKIHDGIGDKVALFVQWIATFFGGFIIGFVKEWRLTLLLVAFTPFLAICGAFFSVVSAPVGRCKIFLFHTILFLSPSSPPPPSFSSPFGPPSTDNRTQLNT